MLQSVPLLLHLYNYLYTYVCFKDITNLTGSNTNSFTVTMNHDTGINISRHLQNIFTKRSNTF
jgi:hypothetical protein